jgi:hypothetical protein
VCVVCVVEGWIGMDRVRVICFVDFFFFIQVMKFQATLSLQQSIQCVRWLRPTAQTYGHKTLYFIAGLSNDPQVNNT